MTMTMTKHVCGTTQAVLRQTGLCGVWWDCNEPGCRGLGPGGGTHSGAAARGPGLVAPESNPRKKRRRNSEGPGKNTLRQTGGISDYC